MADEIKPETPVARPPVEPLVFQGEAQTAYGTTLAEILSFARDLAHAPHLRRILLIAAVLSLVLIINMIGQVFLNQWQGQFYRAIEQRNLNAVWESLLSFLALIAILLSVVVSQTYLHERLKIRLREWLSHRLLDDWLVAGRAYRLSISSDDAVNPDQRIQEDVRNFSEMSTDLGVGLIQASLLLFSFIGVLWKMSENIVFHVQQRQFHVPGYMVWVAILYAVIGSWFAAKVGGPLIALNERRYTREANFRFSVLRFSESAESVAFYGGEGDERKIINRHLEPVLDIMRDISIALAKLTWITSGFGWIMIVLPVLVALPGFLEGALDLGGLMMVVGAFVQVQQALRWFVENFAKIADWRAAMHRVYIFRNAIDMVDRYEEDSEQIHLMPHPQGHLSFENVKISLIDGEIVIADATAHVQPGERVLIVGESGSGKSTLFRAIGGLWPWGMGTICYPPRQQTMFLPQKPYMPLGTLHEALAYPEEGNTHSQNDMKAALERVNLPDFIPQLQRVERWDKLMSLGQQQRFAFARLLLHQPKWVFLDEATSALDEASQTQVMSLFTQELQGTTVLSISHRAELSEFHTRTLQLIATQGGTVLRRRQREIGRLSGWRRLMQMRHRAQRP